LPARTDVAILRSLPGQWPRGRRRTYLDALSSLRGRRSRLVALTAAALLALLVTPSYALALATTGPGKLSDGRASPSSGTTATVFAFSVTYSQQANVAPAVVNVVIDGSSRRMLAVTPSDTNYRDGARFRYNTTLSRGFHIYKFEVTDAKGRDGSALGGLVRVRASSTGGSLGGGTSSGGGSTSSGSGASSSGSGGSSAGSGATGGSGSSGSGAGSSGGSGGSNGGSSSSWESAGSGSSGQSSAATAALGALAGSGAVSVVILPSDALPDGAALGAATTGRAAGQLMGGFGAGLVIPGRGSGLDFMSTMPGYGSDPWVLAMAQTLAMSTTTSVIFAFALLFLARRRRDEEGTRAHELEQTGTAPPDPQQLAKYLYGPQKAAALAAEMALPRWRRPSLMAARASERDRRAQVIASERLTFDRGTVAFGDGREFRKIRYRMVRLSDRPDELMGYELGRLDEGDEVEVLERSAFYVKIRTPYGLEGWVHRTTVGAQLSPEQDRPDSPQRAYNYVGPDDSLVTRLLRERSAV
jgi:hypothetical protein